MKRDSKEQDPTATRDETAGDYLRLREIADKLDADIVALQEVNKGYVKKVFDPAKYNIEISKRRGANQRTALVVRKGLKYKRKPDYEALDVGSVRYGTVIELEAGGRKVDVISVHMKSGCFSNADQASTTTKKKSGSTCCLP